MRAGAIALPNASATRLSLPSARYAALNLSPEKQKARTVDTLIDPVIAQSRKQPAPLFVEELTKTVLKAGLLRDAGDRHEMDSQLA